MKHDYEKIYTQIMVAFAKLDAQYNRQRPEDMQHYKRIAAECARMAVDSSCALGVMKAKEMEMADD